MLLHKSSQFVKFEQKLDSHRPVTNRLILATSTRYPLLARNKALSRNVDAKACMLQKLYCAINSGRPRIQRPRICGHVPIMTSADEWKNTIWIKVATSTSAGQALLIWHITTDRDYKGATESHLCFDIPQKWGRGWTSPSPQERQKNETEPSMSPK